MIFDRWKVIHRWDTHRCIHRYTERNLCAYVFVCICAHLHISVMHPSSQNSPAAVWIMLTAFLPKWQAHCRNGWEMKRDLDSRFISIFDKLTSFFFFPWCPSYCQLHPVGDLYVLVYVLIHLEVNLRLRPRANSLFLVKMWCWLGQNFVSAVSGISGAWMSDLLSLGTGHPCMVIGQKKVKLCSRLLLWLPKAINTNFHICVLSLHLKHRIWLEVPISGHHVISFVKTRLTKVSSMKQTSFATL